MCSFLYIRHLITLCCVGRLVGCWIKWLNVRCCVRVLLSKSASVCCVWCVRVCLGISLSPSFYSSGFSSSSFQIPFSIQHPLSHCPPSTLSPLPPPTPSSAMCVCVCAYVCCQLFHAVGATRMSAVKIRRHHHMRAACQLSARPETLCERFWC